MEKDYLDGIDVIYWINLDRAKDRYKHMTDLFKDDIFKNKKIIRKKALDYTEKNLANMMEISDLRHTEQEYSCLLSHLETIRLFSETNYKTALIIEDDISLDFKPYWVKTIQEVIDGAPKDWDILKLYVKPNSIYKYKKLYTLWDANIIVHYIGKKFENTVNKKKFTTNDFGTVAYLINNKAAKKIIKNIYHNKKYVLDDCLKRHLADYFIYKSLKTYVYKYPFFTFKKNNISYIGANPKWDKIISDQDYKVVKVLKSYKNKKSIKNNTTRKNNKTRKNKKA